ncbi:NAD(P)-dependent oxidoreductase [Actibacterium sp. MT2.3-13A]|uniref:NAD(P)-dependent oxidoreductase n=1 Tax=Actibacterium sp. MT2.3-13A TaxID=2828332 RepID=UPI001BA7E3EC|nr:NAD(P)-dependent oxidoreductase [Actibacterium sp. MT2.3-13A]
MKDCAFIGYGEAARAFRETLAEHAPEMSFRAYDIKLDGAGGEEMRAAMRRDGVTIAPSPAALAGSGWVFSAVTADQSLAAARSVASHIGAGTVFIDINSVSPGRKRETAALIEKGGAAYLDMAVMAPVHPRGHRTPVLVAGAALALALPRLKALGFDYRVAGEAAGAATAIKMIRSQFVKGLEAITVETLLAAEAAGVFGEILASLSSSYPGLGWPDFAEYQFERTLRHGARRAAEMEESAATVAALGLNGGLGAEVAAVQAAMGQAGAACRPRATLHETVAAALATRRDGQSG